MRRYVLVSYDVSDPKRWRRVYKIMRGHGTHVQYSVFLCQLTEQDEVALRCSLAEVIHPSVDQVLFARLGPVDSNRLEKTITCIGRDFAPLDLKGLVF
ncbi:MAG: CRISPR-associated endonuclease Cas2 [Thermoflavifilum sp.]|nr:CRISPR-associated endonuclease Cas2 [Thermoflavifilum sp.]MCL6514647.1 CRISPR-associated endonuclease Cas2 [Alicyclobacillus sp.]